MFALWYISLAIDEYRASNPDRSKNLAPERVPAAPKSSTVIPPKPLISSPSIPQPKNNGVEKKPAEVKPPADIRPPIDIKPPTEVKPPTNIKSPAEVKPPTDIKPAPPAPLADIRPTVDTSKIDIEDFEKLSVDEADIAGPTQPKQPEARNIVPEVKKPVLPKPSAQPTQDPFDAKLSEITQKINEKKTFDNQPKPVANEPRDPFDQKLAELSKKYNDKPNESQSQRIFERPSARLADMPSDDDSISDDSDH